MTEIFQNLTDVLNDIEINRLLKHGKIGFEKECLRVVNNQISQSPHPISIGSSLCSKYITTDFSEAQLELITPPYDNNINALRFLDDIQHFVSNNLGNEILWPFSVPPNIDSDRHIPIGKYGISNEGKFRELYRKGLAQRYGRQMQSISGFHVNYSLSEDIWELPLLKKSTSCIKDLRSESYMNMLRNIFEMNWIILFLFGSTPVIPKKLSNIIGGSQKPLNGSLIYMPYATSLRMSDFGYNNLIRSKLKVSLNSTEEYTSDLLEATKTISEAFHKISLDKTNQMQQINSNVLQIEDEYYAVARAKSKIQSKDRLLKKLKIGGINYIELRSLDLNPFNRLGIEFESVLFIELLLVYCFFKKSRKFNKNEIQKIIENDLNVSKYGRKPNLHLLRNNKKVSLVKWGNDILDEMTLVAEKFGEQSEDYLNIINKYRLQINDPRETLSALFLDQITLNKNSFVNFGNHLGEERRKYYSEIKQVKNKNWEYLAEEAKKSVLRQSKLENTSEKSFDKYVRDYFKL